MYLHSLFPCNVCVHVMCVGMLCIIMYVTMCMFVCGHVYTCVAVLFPDECVAKSYVTTKPNKVT